MHGFKIKEEKDINGHFKSIEGFKPFSDLHKALPKFTGNTSESLIIITLKVGEDDINNMNHIKSEKEKYEQILNKHRNPPKIDFINNWDFEILKANKELEYEIKEFKLSTYENNSPENMFLSYLNFIDLFVAISKEIEGIVLKPVFLYFSPYRFLTQDGLQVDIRSEEYYSQLPNYYGINSKAQMSLLKLSTLYLALKKRKYISEAEKEGYLDKWNNDEEVKFIKNYMGKLGYSWKLEKQDTYGFFYELIISKKSDILMIDNASSGEKEVINFLLGILSFNIKNGLIVIDEPDLHLHAKWETALIDLFIELAGKTGNQFIMATHSSRFINTKTISNIVRVYQDDTNSSKTVYPDNTDLGKFKDLLHIVNSHNNERMFFADKVILVEGIQDRLVFKKLFNHFSEDKNQNSQIIEILEVHGKNNLQKYRDFLSNFKIDNFIIADFDYLDSIGSVEVKKLFVTDKKKAEEEVFSKGKKSLDRKTLIEDLEKGIRNNNLKIALPILEHIKSRFKIIKNKLTVEEMAAINDNIKNLKEEKDIHILKYGELEAYLPNGFKKIEKTIELVKDKNFEDWISNIEEDEKLKELKDIVINILGKQANIHKEIEIIDL